MSDLISKLDTHAEVVKHTLSQFDGYDDARLNRRPLDGGWSALQTMHHLILAESMSLRYVQKKVSGGDLTNLPDTGLQTWYRELVLRLYLRFGGKIKAPSVVSTELLPAESTLADVRKQWTHIHMDWRNFAQSLPAELHHKAVYKHPAIGRLSWGGMVNFFDAHLQRHIKQMKKAVLSIVIILFCAAGLLAQDEPKELLGCGAPPGISKWLKTYLDAPQEYATAADSVIYTRLKLHLLAKDDGTGRFRVGSILDALCRLDKDFESSKIQFFYDSPWDSINKTAWHDHNALTTGIQMMLQNDVDSAINTYFVADPAGNCGYNLPYAGVALSHNCSGAGDHTWAHEIGHNLRLPHPFLGWEGKTYDYTKPTPLTLTYDYTNFHDTLDTGPTLDTAFVEFVDRSKNCGIAADRLCLTPPDYIAQRWVCNTMGMSSTKQKDPDGVDFFSDGSYFMSYANDACQNRFSDDEIAVMRANLMQEKKTHTNLNFSHKTIDMTTAALMPIGGQNVSADQVRISFKQVPNATHYVVQLNRFAASFPLIDLEVVTTDTFITALNLLPNRTYHYRVKPFNNSYWCAPYSPVAQFFTLPSTSVQNLDMTEWFLYPTLMSDQSLVYVHMPDQTIFEGTITVTDVHGRVLQSIDNQLLVSGGALRFSDLNLATGMYYITLREAKGQRVFKMIKQ
jgi:DinB superfamily